MSDETPISRILPDPQDPLPEANWLWRRVFTFAVLILAFGIAIGLGWALNRIVGNVVGRLDTMDARNVAQITIVALNVIAQMFKMMFYIVLFNMLLYIVAPSAEQITKMIQTARLLRGGVQIASRAKAELPGRREETQATIGLPPQPVVPPGTPQEHDSAPQPHPTTPAAPEAPDEAPWAKKE